MATAFVTGNQKYNPDYMNNGGFFQAVNLLKWTNLYPSFNDYHYSKPMYTLSKNNPAFARVHASIIKSLQSGHLVLLGITFSPALPDGTVQHTVLAVGTESKNNIIIHDPAGGDLKTLQHYWSKSQWSGLYQAMQINNKVVTPVKKSTNVGL